MNTASVDGSQPPETPQTPNNPPEHPQPVSQEEAERRARIEYLRSVAKPRQTGRSWPKWLIAAVLVIAMAGGAAYWFLFRTPPAKQNTGSSDTIQQATNAQPEEADAPTKQHESTHFFLAFDYPETWTVTDDGSGQIIIKSPATRLKAAGGQNAQGQVAITIQGKQASLEEFKRGNAVAARDSEKITYLKPTSSQRAQTYLSFANYAGSQAKGTDAVFITGDSGYQKDQAIPMVDIAKVDPLIRVSFTRCNGTDCAGSNGAAGLTIATESWETTAALKAARALLTSLSIQ